MKILFYLIVLICLVCSFSCSRTETPQTEQTGSNKTRPEKKTNNNKKELTEKTSNSYNQTKTPDKPNRSEAEYKLAKKKCEEVDTGDNFLLKSQTFPFDEKPFEGSCFVTEHNPEFDDPPLGSEISIYKGGKRVYRFDSRYNPDSATCYVEAVSFQDLNEDKLTDIIVAGKCGAKSGEIIGNEVFINTGTDFYTNTEANDKLETFTKIKEIADFVRKNQEIFEPNG